MIEYDLPNLSQRFAVLSLNPWSADVVNSITTPGMNEYTWHGDIFLDKYLSTWEDTFKPGASTRLNGWAIVCESANDLKQKQKLIQ